MVRAHDLLGWLTLAGPADTSDSALRAQLFGIGSAVVVALIGAFATIYVSKRRNAERPTPPDQSVADYRRRALAAERDLRAVRAADAAKDARLHAIYRWCARRGIDADMIVKGDETDDAVRP